MRLKKLDIIGFKSFADKTTLEFSPGVTAIVGPNGCGKSNISDAFRWVLGEQSAKSLRGGKMPDIIFAGTTQRAPLNFAEVTITLADVNGKLPIDYDEVAVTRRLHRSGESQYFINRQLVRLKDVQDLFLDSGMGKDAFAIFEQGKIDNIINYSPLERRYIFEEAAGILRFLQRKREALRKMEQTDLNVSRIKDIHQEVEKQIVVLEHQAQQARIYKENKASLELFEKGLFVLKWDNLQRRFQESRKKESLHKISVLEITEQAIGLHSQLQSAKIELDNSEKNFREKSESLYQARSEKEIKSREKLSTQERLKETLSKEKRWQHELESIAEQERFRQEEQVSLKKEQQLCEKHLSAHEQALHAERDTVQRQENLVVKLREQQQTSQKELLNWLQTENRLESELKQNKIRQENQQEQLELLQVRKDKLVLQMKELTQAVADKKQQMQDVTEGIDEQKFLYLALDQKLKKLSEEMQKERLALEKLQYELSELKARQNVLIRLRNEKEGFSAGSKRLLQESVNEKSPLFQKIQGLYEWIIPNEGAEKALSAVLRPYSHTLVVKTETDFKEVLSFAKEHQLKEFSLLCCDMVLKYSNDEKRELKSELSLKSLLSQVSAGAVADHFLRNIYMANSVDDIEHILNKKAAAAIWTEEGAFFDRHKVLFFMTQGENNVFLREAELKSLEKKLVTLEEHRQSCDAKIKKMGQQKAEIEEEKSILDRAMRRDEMTLVEVNFGLQRLLADLEKVKKEEKQVESDHLNLVRLIEKLTETLAEFQQKHSEAKTKATEIQQRSSSVNTDLETHSTSFKEAQLCLQEKEAAYRKGSDENRKLLHALNVLEVQVKESDRQKKRLGEEIHLSGEYQAQIKQKGLQTEQALQEIEKSLAFASEECLLSEQEVKKQKKIIETIDQSSEGIRNKLKQGEEELYRLTVQSTQLETGIKGIEGELEERYHLAIEQARSSVLSCETGIIEKSVDSLEKQIRALRQQIDSAGDINMTSIEEFEKHKSRYDFLNQQIDDLAISKAELVQIITQLDGESRKLFEDTFAKVRANFKKNFEILFRGGEADLQFTESADVLEAGIEIIAKPPGKQMRSMQLLSGGEKCLTAMALLFAIFEVKPAPFCILDEIDAPLDDTNVERFVAVVKHFIDRCQFLIITHNKRTMAVADVLFGVSMQERGVSKLLSLQFARQEAEALI